MALPKGKLMALLAVFAAIGIVTATGAFTTVTADRTASAAVVSDANANLGLTPYDGPNGIGDGTQTNSQGYAQLNNGELTLALNKFNTSDGGLNLNARTTINYVFNISNNGNSQIEVYIDASGGDHPEKVSFWYGEVGTGINVTEGSGNTVTINSGTTASFSLEIDLRGTSMSPNDEVFNTFTIYANTTADQS